MSVEVEFFMQQDPLESAETESNNIEDKESRWNLHSPELHHQAPIFQDPPTIKMEVVFPEAENDYLSSSSHEEVVENFLEDAGMDWIKNPPLSPETVLIKEDPELFQNLEHIAEETGCANLQSTKFSNGTNIQKSALDPKAGSSRIHPAPRVSGSEFFCPLCNLSFTQRRRCSRHIKLHFIDKSCKICGQSFKGTDIAEHKKMHASMKKGLVQKEKSRYCCDICGSRFNMKRECARHIRAHFREKRCKVCDIHVNCAELGDHMKTHIGQEEAYRQKDGPSSHCTVSDQGIVSKPKRIRPIKLWEDEKTILCKVCGSKLKRRDFTVHMNTHKGTELEYMREGTSQFLCTICHFFFEDKSNCVEHIGRHFEEKPCRICDICVHATDIDEHMKTHPDKEEAYLQKKGSSSYCTICGLNFPQKSNCLRHIKAHLHKKLCRLCGDRYELHDLAEHMKTHSGEEEAYVRRDGTLFCCTICGASSDRKNNCMRHIRSHLSEKSCKFCGDRLNPDNFAEHMKTHSGKEEAYVRRDGTLFCCTICGASSDRKNNCLRHIRSHLTEKSCKFCGERLNPDNFAEHMKTHSCEEEKYLQKDGSQLRCTICGSSFQLKSNCLRHIRLHIEDKPCKVCGMGVKRVDMSEHMKIHASKEETYLQKNGSEYSCTICGSSAKLRFNCVRHIKLHFEERPCKFCGENVSFDDFTNHMKKHMGKEETYMVKDGSVYSCTICGYKSQQRSNSLRHIKLHIEEIPCKVCGVSIKRDGVAEHMKTHSTKEEAYMEQTGSEFRCTICGSSFARRPNCLRHVSLHLDEKSCRVCGDKFSPDDLAEHMKTHMGKEEVYLQRDGSFCCCTICGLSFPHKYNCVRHIKLHLEERSCRVCGVSVKRIDFPKHMKTHPRKEETCLLKKDSQSYCTVCGLSFDRKFNCLRHISSHFEEKTCKFCGDSITMDNFAEHMKTHEGKEKTFLQKTGSQHSCTICGATFKAKSNCVRHVRYHFEKRQCKICGKSINRSDIAEHMKTHVGEEEKYLRKDGSQSCCTICGTMFLRRFNCLRHIKSHLESKGLAEQSNMDSDTSESHHEVIHQEIVKAEFMDDSMGQSLSSEMESESLTGDISVESKDAQPHIEKIRGSDHDPADTCSIFEERSIASTEKDQEFDGTNDSMGQSALHGVSLIRKDSKMSQLSTRSHEDVEFESSGQCQSPAVNTLGEQSILSQNLEDKEPDLREEKLEVSSIHQ